MKFRLHYQGSLRSNGGIGEKQRLRRAFQPQLRDLWTRVPLRLERGTLLSPTYLFTAIKEVNGWQFASVVNANNYLIASLDIMMLRPEEPGNVVTQSGDIDNRLKTLFDALKIPEPGQIPARDSARDDEHPFHCLLEDDNLITEVHVTVDRLLGSNNDPHQVLMIIGVEVSATRATVENLGLIT